MDTNQTGCVGHTVFKCSLPAPEFGVVDVFKFLFADAGYPVSQKFNEVQSGFKRVFKRRHVEVLLQAAVTDCRLTESEEVHASVSSSINVTVGCKCATTGKKFPRAVYFFAQSMHILTVFGSLATISCSYSGLKCLLTDA